MKTFFIITTLIILLFGFSVGAYLSCYKFNFENTVVRAISTLVLGLLISFIVFVIAVVAIWP